MKFSEIIFLIDLVLALLIYLVLYNVCGKRKFVQDIASKNNCYKPMAFMEKKCNIYIRSSITWDFIYHWITLSSMIASTVVIYLSTIPIFNEVGSGTVDTGRVFIYSSVSLFLTLAVYVLEPKKKAVAYRNAYQILAFALDRHPIIDVDPIDSDEKGSSISDDNWIAEALEKAEEILSEAHK